MQKLHVFILIYRVFDVQRMRWLTGQNGWTGEFQELRIKRCVFKAIWMEIVESS